MQSLSNWHLMQKNHKVKTLSLISLLLQSEQSLVIQIFTLMAAQEKKAFAGLQLKLSIN